MATTSASIVQRTWSAFTTFLTGPQTVSVPCVGCTGAVVVPAAQAAEEPVCDACIDARAREVVFHPDRCENPGEPCSCWSRWDDTGRVGDEERRALWSGAYEAFRSVPSADSVNDALDRVRAVEPPSDQLQRDAYDAYCAWVARLELGWECAAVVAAVLIPIAVTRAAALQTGATAFAWLLQDLLDECRAAIQVDHGRCGHCGAHASIHSFVVASQCLDPDGCDACQSQSLAASIEERF